LPAHGFGGRRYRPHWHKRLDACSHDHPFAVRLLPEIVPMPGLAELEPAALGRSPHDCGLEYFDRPRWSWLHANFAGKARAPCFRSKAAIAGLNQRGVSQALTGTALPVRVHASRAPRSPKRVGDKPLLPAPVVFLSSRPGRNIVVMASSPNFHHHHAGNSRKPRRPPYGASSCAVINL
jgi:hypothetical protein